MGSAGVVILGAGQAGTSAAAFLRQFGYADPITLLGDEPHAPYQRPPLSKAWLKREADADSLALRPPAFWAEQGITLRTGITAAAIDPVARRVTLRGGDTLAYEHLILALGAAARCLPLPGFGLDGVRLLRDVADADRLQAALVPGARLVVVGGGYIGLEVAASARALGASVVVLERETRVLARVASASFSARLHAHHETQGVEIVCGAEVEALEGNGHVRAVRLRDGRAIACDVALIGCGAVPRDELARAAGLPCESGIVVDEHARTADPHIFAAGDCTLRPVPRYGRSLRVESVPSAIEQARAAAAAITGRPQAAPEVPWFWSDQYDLRLQLAGFLFDVTETAVREAGGGVALFHLRADGAVQAVEAINAAADFTVGRRLIQRATPVDPARLADPQQSLRALVT